MKVRSVQIGRPSIQARNGTTIFLKSPNEFPILYFSPGWDTPRLAIYRDDKEFWLRGLWSSGIRPDAVFVRAPE
jgi:hypothetical protein